MRLKVFFKLMSSRIKTFFKMIKIELGEKRPKKYRSKQVENNIQDYLLELKFERFDWK